MYVLRTESQELLSFCDDLYPIIKQAIYYERYDLNIELLLDDELIYSSDKNSFFEYNGEMFRGLRVIKDEFFKVELDIEYMVICVASCNVNSNWIKNGF